jgi:predicted acetyltransferase
MRDDGESRRRILLWEGADGPEGYAFFRTKIGGGSGIVRVGELHALTPDAHRGLLGFMADIDLTEKVLYRTRPADDPLPWMLADSRAVTRTSAEYVWFRLVDLPKALTARTYESDGALVLDVRDGFCDRNEGLWRIEVDAGRATCERTSAEADLTIDVADLAALYMGGRSALPLAEAGRIEGHRAAAVTLDRMFRTRVAPWSPEHF